MSCYAAELPEWLEAAQVMQQLRKKAQEAAAGGNALILTFVNYDYKPLLVNWLAWLKASKVDIGQVLVRACVDRLQTCSQTGSSNATLVASNPAAAT